MEQITFLSFLMGKKRSINIYICSVSGVVHIITLMRSFVFEIVMEIKGICVESL